MNPYAPPEGRIEDAQRRARPRLGAFVWIPLFACVLHRLFFMIVLMAVAVLSYADTESSFPLGEIMKPTLVLLPASTLVAAWMLYRRKRIAILPSACLPIAIAARFSRMHAVRLFPVSSAASCSRCTCSG